MDFINRCGSWLAYVHVNNNLGVHDDHLGYQEGTVPWEAVLKATLKTGFSSPYIIEFGKPNTTKSYDANSTEKFRCFSRDLRFLATKHLGKGCDG